MIDVNNLNQASLAKLFDHTLLWAYATKEDFKAFCEESKEMGVGMVAINPYPVKTCKEFLKGTDIHVGAAIAFPLGQMNIESKLFETSQAIKDGADEIDYVLNIAKVKEHDYAYIKDEMEQMVELCHSQNIIIKVIFENCYLEKTEIKQLALIAKEVKPDFIKTSTGFGTGGATIEDVKLMVETVAGEVGVKAAGHIRDWETCKTMLELGATRIGTRSSKIILEGFKKERGL